MKILTKKSLNSIRTKAIYNFYNNNNINITPSYQYVYHDTPKGTKRHQDPN